jgi:hypothetical protein
MSLKRASQNNADCFGQGFYRKVRLLGLPFPVSVVDKQHAAACGVACLNVAPAVSNKVAAGKINPHLFRCFQQHSRLGLSTCAVIRVRVVADLYGVDRKPLGKIPIYRFDDFASLFAQRDVWLIGNNYIRKACGAQRFQSLGDAGKDFDLRHAAWRIRLAIPNERSVKHTVAVEEDRSLLQAAAYHFVAIC